MNKTSIEWTDFTANPLKFRAPDGRVVWACEKLSAGCANCYAEHLSTRYGGTRRAGDWNAGTMATLTPFLDEKELRAMLAYKPASGKRVFVGDMTDVFGSWVPDELLDRLFAVFALRPDVTFQVLTKRAERLRDYLAGEAFERVSELAMSYQYAGNFDDEVEFDARDAHENMSGFWPLPNVWLGVSVENQRFADERIPLLLQTPAAVRFISAEPLLGPIDLNALPDTKGDPSWDASAIHGVRECAFGATVSREQIPALDWVIVGGESGHGARPFNLAWAHAIVGQCHDAGVACFVKQLGSSAVITCPDCNGTGTGKTYRDADFCNCCLGCHLQSIVTRDRKGGDPSEWPADLRVRQFPTGGA